MSDLESRWHELISGENRAWWTGAARGGLAALSTLYGGAVSTYRRGYDLGLLKAQRLPCPVISVGNITVGGTGKTTTVRWLARRLAEWGLQPAVLSYGYRAGEKQEANAVTVVADLERVLQPVQVSGDEPQLLARSLPGVPVLIGRRRIRSGRVACREFCPDALILDDGFQYWRLIKDLEIVLINATNPFGFGRLLPRGMLREPVWGLRRAHAAIITHARWMADSDRAALGKRLLGLNPHLLIVEARHVPVRLRDARTGETLPLDTVLGGRWMALSSLGSPESFERTLAELGARDVEPARFPDHHPYSAQDLRRVFDRLRSAGLAGVVTTEKDSVKIPTEWLANERLIGQRCLVLEIDLEFLRGQDAVESLLRSRVRTAAAAATD